MISSTDRKKRRGLFDAVLAIFLLLTVLLRVSNLSHDSNDNDYKDGEPSGRRLSERQLSAQHHFIKAMESLDFSEYSCDNLYEHAMNDTIRCAYAQTCNDGDGIFAPIVYCSEEYSTRFLSLCLGVPLALFLIILFRVLGSTAEEFFSPGLEMMSLEMGLPERFAGVTLLALGNGAPDVASTVSAILNDRKLGYLMALGELTGAAMVASTVIVGAVVFVADGVSCGGALVRDVVMFILTMIVVYFAFSDGGISLREIHIFVGMYVLYVVVVLAADMYNRKRSGHVVTENGETTALTGGRRRRPSYDAVANAISNYGIDRKESERLPLQQQDVGQQAGWGQIDGDGTEPLMVFHPHHGGMVDLKTSERFVAANGVHSNSGVGRSPESWAEGWTLAWAELKEHVVKLLEETYYSDEYTLFEKFLMTCELPFTVLRMVSVCKVQS